MEVESPARAPSTIYQGFVGKHYEKIYTGLIKQEDTGLFRTKLMMGKGEVCRYRLVEAFSEPDNTFLRTYASGSNSVSLLGSLAPTNEPGIFLVAQHMVRGDERSFFDEIMNPEFMEIKYDVFYFKGLNIEVVVSDPSLAQDGNRYCLVEIKVCSIDNSGYFINRSNIIQAFLNSLLPFDGFVEKRKQIKK